MGAHPQALTDAPISCIFNSASSCCFRNAWLQQFPQESLQIPADREVLNGFKSLPGILPASGLKI